MNLNNHTYNQTVYRNYILGSAEVFGLMCLKVFLDGNNAEYERLKTYAKSLGSAFQKIYFLRDVKADYHTLGRTYFPDVNLEKFDQTAKSTIETDIENDFRRARKGIIQLHKGVKRGVYMAYIYPKLIIRRHAMRNYMI